MRALYKAPDSTKFHQILVPNDLRTLQQLVGGYIETVTAGTGTAGTRTETGEKAEAEEEHGEGSGHREDKEPPGSRMDTGRNRSGNGRLTADHSEPSEEGGYEVARRWCEKASKCPHTGLK